MAGRKEELFKAFLFADQDLDDIVREIKPPAGSGALADAADRLREGQPAEAEVVLTAAMITRPREVGPWHRLLLAAALEGKGNRAGATRALQQLVDSRPGSRIRLWGFAALRKLGVEPAPAPAEGTIVEVDSGRGVETLAAYADGTARYVLPTGARVLWDKPDARLDGHITAVMTAASAAASALPAGRLAGDPPPQSVRATLLLPSGPRAAEVPLAEAGSGPFGELFRAATSLVDEIITIAKW